MSLALRCPVCGTLVAVPAAVEAACPLHCSWCRAGFTLTDVPPAIQNVPTIRSSGMPAPLLAPPGYLLERELGRGGMGVVYLARHAKLDRPCALKMILGPIGVEERVRFETEARAIARLQHPHIVQVFEVGESVDAVSGTVQPFMALEYCPGGSLDQRLARDPLPAVEAARLVRTLADAMQVAHEAQVIHRDLKPANILLTADGTPKVADFGLARRLDEAGATRSGMLLGTPSYMPPEQAMSRKNLGPAVDIYALGAILYACLTGRPPFRAATAMETLRQVLDTEAVSVRQLNPGVPRDLETICLKCLRKDPAHRYASARELADDLGRFLNGEAIRARPLGLVGRGARWVRRYPVVAALAAAVVLVLLAGIGVASYFALEAGREAKAAREAQGRAETNETRAKFEALRASTGQHAGQIGTAWRDWRERDLRQMSLVLDRVPAPFGDNWETRHLRDLRDRTCRLLGQMAAPIEGLCLGPDGKAFLVGGRDGTLHLRDLATGREIQTIPGPASPVVSVCYRPDGKVLASSHASGALILRDATTGAEQRTLCRDPTPPATSLCFSPDGHFLVSGSSTGVLHLWDCRTGEVQGFQAQHKGRVGSLCFSPDGKTILSAAEDITPLVWSVETRAPVQTLRGHTERAPRACFSPDGATILTGALGVLKLWDARTGREQRSIQGHADRIVHVGFSADGKTFSSASRDHSLKVWDTASGQVVRALQGVDFAVGVCLDPQGDTLVADHDGRLWLWPVQTTQEALLLHAHPGGVASVCVRPDGKAILSTGQDRLLKEWDLRTGQKVREIPGLSSPVAEAVYSSDGAAILAGGGYSIPQLWDAKTGQEERLAGNLPQGACTCFTPDGKSLVVATLGQGFDAQGKREPSEVRILDTRTGREVTVLERPSAAVRALGFSRDGTRVLAATDDGLITLWDAATGGKMKTFQGHVLGNAPGCLSRDGKLLLTAGLDSSITLWNVATGEELHTLKGHRAPVRCATFSPDGKLVASGGTDGLVILWDTVTGQEMLSLPGHAGWVSSVAFSPDGRFLISGGLDGTLRVWEAPPLRAE
jgi:WD40 repeat protein